MTYESNVSSSEITALSVSIADGISLFPEFLLSSSASQLSKTHFRARKAETMDSQPANMVVMTIPAVAMFAQQRMSMIKMTSHRVTRRKM